MIDLQQIVVATDLSANSLPAVRYACDLASQFGAHLHLLTIVRFPLENFVEECQRDFGRLMDDVEREYQQQAEENLTAIDVAPLTKTDHVTRTARSGFPVREIPDYASEVGCDLLILGTHGFSGLQHVLMGSVCESVTRRAECPVLTVRSA